MTEYVRPDARAEQILAAVALELGLQTPALWRRRSGDQRVRYAYDGHGDGTVVRAPYHLAKIAWEHVLANSKVPPSARWNPSLNPDYQEVA